ncbi:MAG: sugar phosphate nucleotidyltransferase [Candidatus Aminicenantales bacterium]
MNPTLVILAAGMGSRYGSLKQIDAVGPAGEVLMDYSIYDAVRAGFDRVIFIIRKSIEKEFKEVFISRLKNKVGVDYVFQILEDVPGGISIPEGRTKPWGTAHSVLAAEAKVKGPFAVINADDFYGSRSFKAMANFLTRMDSRGMVYSLMGFELKNTLSEHGAVARAVCTIGKSGRLTGIVERLHVEQTPEGIFYEDEKRRPIRLNGSEIVSMNLWGFTASVFKYLKAEFELFIRENYRNTNAELYIPLVIDKIVKSGRAEVRVLRSPEKWFGITYKEERRRVTQELRKLIRKGVYPEKLWE